MTRHSSTYRGAKRNAVRKERAEQLKKKRAKKLADLEAEAQRRLSFLKTEIGGND